MSIDYQTCEHYLRSRYEHPYLRKHDGVWDNLCFSLSYLSKVRDVDESKFPLVEFAYSHCFLSRAQIRHSYKLEAPRRVPSVVEAYLLKCVGHKIPDSVFFVSPLICVLVARDFFGGRWRACEDSVVGDSVAAYFYAKLLGGLPSEMHAALGLRSFGGVDYALRRYFLEFAQI